MLERTRFPTYDISSPSSPKSSTGGGDGNYRGPKRAVPPSLEDLLSDCLVLPLRLRFYINAKPAPPSNSKMLEGFIRLMPLQLQARRDRS